VPDAKPLTTVTIEAAMSMYANQNHGMVPVAALAAAERNVCQCRKLVIGPFVTYVDGTPTINWQAYKTANNL
jgi:hypothetical protein